MAASGDANMIRTYLDKATADPGHGLFRLWKAFGAVVDLCDPARALRILAATVLRDFPPLLERLCAEAAFFAELSDKAARRLERLDRALWGHFADTLRAALFARQGESDRAARLLAPVRAAMPWHVNLTLVLHDLIRGPRPCAQEPIGPDDAAVLLYTWNKAALIADTLETLAATRLGPSPVIVLDNGSTDDTPDVLRRAADRFPSGAFAVVTLPVNVARRRPATGFCPCPRCRQALRGLCGRRRPPPEDWLALLLGAARDNPTAGAVGCAVADIPAPHRLQSADYHLLPPEAGHSLVAEMPERIFVMDAWSGRPDFGLHRYRRPALSVTGCCHLVSLAAVRAAGPFDIRFTPTQFDDLERDMRSWLRAGRRSTRAG